MKWYFLIKQLLLLPAFIAQIWKAWFGAKNGSKISKNELNPNIFKFWGNIMKWYFLEKWLLLLAVLAALIAKKLKALFGAEKWIKKLQKWVIEQ